MSVFIEDPRGIWDNQERIRAYSRFLVQKPVLSGHHSPAPIINISHQNHSNSFQDVLECFYHRLQLIFTYQTVRNSWWSGGGQILIEAHLEESFKGILYPLGAWDLVRRDLQCPGTDGYAIKVWKINVFSREISHLHCSCRLTLILSMNMNRIHDCIDWYQFRLIKYYTNKYCVSHSAMSLY